MDEARSLIIKVLKSHKDDLIDIWNNMIVLNKDSMSSAVTRQTGNARYLQKNHDAQAHIDIFSLYCKSIALAPLKSQELALAYGNRSAFLLHINEYKDCVKDIDKALEITTSNTLKIKLLHRKIKCLSKLGCCDYQELLEEVRSLGNDTDGYKEKAMVELISRLKVCSFKSEDSIQNHSNEERTVPETKNVQNFVVVQNDKMYGRHLVAAKDYQPGDIILVEKFFASAVNSKMMHIVCNYCYKTYWSCIPCNSCAWAMFCSDYCREKAWQAYHDIECAVISCCNVLNVNVNNFGLSLRMSIIAIKEAGGLAELRAWLHSMDQCNDKQTGQFFTNNDSMKNRIKSMYFLKSDGLSRSLQENVSKALVVPLIALVKYTQLVQNFAYDKSKDLSTNKDIVFLGSLLQKFAMISIFNSYQFSDEHQIMCNHSRSIIECRQHDCCNKATCLLLLTSLINHSCVPNAGKCFTRDQKLIIYASQPIKKNCQIFISYICNFYDAPVTDRRDFLKHHNFECKCKACKESWPPFYFQDKPTLQSFLELKLFADCGSIFEALDGGKTYFEKKEIKGLSENITQALKTLKQPSYLTCAMDEAMKEIFARTYLRPQLIFKKCDTLKN